MIGRATICIVSLAFLTSAGAQAQAPSPVPDVVILRDGGLVRGTIVEAPADGPVTIQLVTGDVRTYPRADVEYAGPESSRPVPPRPLDVHVPTSQTAVPAESPPSVADVPAPSRDEVRLRVTSVTPGLELNVQTGSATITAGLGYGSGGAVLEQYRALCTAPCEATLPRGTYSLMVRDERGRTYAVRERTSVSQPSELALGLRRPRGARIAGTVLMAVGVVLSAVGFSQVPKYDILDESSQWNTHFALGCSGLGLIGIGGMTVGFIRTRGVIEVRPMGFAPH
jgi:hypothetical protein